MKVRGNLFKGKRVTLMGLGLLGRGVGDAVFLVKAGAELTVTDLKNERELVASLKNLKKFKNIRFVLGGHRLKDFQNADMIIKAAGVPLDSPFIAEARKHGVPVVMSTAIFAELTKAKVVGITGTRGKSTVAYLLREILKVNRKKAKNSGRCFLAGNILGVSTLGLLPKAAASDVVVLELDSWQLQGFGDTHERALPKKFHGFSPPVAVFTTFMPDHLNYYAGDLKRYFADKANIYRFQKMADVLIVGRPVMDFVKKFGPTPRAKVTIAAASDVPGSWKVKIPGEHNRLNIALAAAAARALGVPEKTIRTAVESFRPVPGRLEFIGKRRGIEIYNDTNATTPEATIAGLRAIAGDSEIQRTALKSAPGFSQKTVQKPTKTNPKIVLIFGGADKKLDPKPLLEILPDYIKAAVVLPGTGTDLIKNELEKLGQEMPVRFARNMAEAVELAFEQAVAGDRILMSPAFASFGLFKNEYDRGDQFKKIAGDRRF